MSDQTRIESSPPSEPITLLTVGSTRDNNLDFIRLIMASLVILTHSFDVFIPTTQPEPLTFVTRGQITSGAFAVGVFFIISGYLVTASWVSSKSVVEFFKKRVLRVYPGFIVACFVSLFLIGPLGASDVGQYYSGISGVRFLKDAFLLEMIEMPPAFVAPFTANGSIWMIQIEFLCYILLGILGAMRMLNRLTVVLGIVASWILMSVPSFPELFAAIPGYRTIAFMNSHFRFAHFFFLGSLGYLMRASVPYRSSLAYIALAAFVFGSVSKTGLLFFPLSMAYLTAFAGFYPGLPISGFAARRGDLSYGIYLYGWPVQFALATLLGRDQNPYWFSLLSLPLAALCAVFSWHFVEHPALRLKGRWTTRPERPAAAPLT